MAPLAQDGIAVMQSNERHPACKIIRNFQASIMENLK